VHLSERQVRRSPALTAFAWPRQGRWRRPHGRRSARPWLPSCRVAFPSVDGSVRGITLMRLWRPEPQAAGSSAWQMLTRRHNAIPVFLVLLWILARGWLVVAAPRKLSLQEPQVVPSIWVAPGIPGNLVPIGDRRQVEKNPSRAEIAFWLSVPRYGSPVRHPTAASSLWRIAGPSVSLGNPTAGLRVSCRCCCTTRQNRPWYLTQLLRAMASGSRRGPRAGAWRTNLSCPQRSRRSCVAGGP